MLVPTLAAPHHALLTERGIDFAVRVGTPAGTVPFVRACISRSCHVDLPNASEYRPDPESPQNSPLDPLPPILPAPFRSSFDPTDQLAYSYTRTDTRGRVHTETGTDTISPAQAELLGWLVGCGTMRAEGQSVRLAARNQAAIHRIYSVLAAAAPTCQVKVYPTVSGFDMTVTGGDIRHQIRRMDLVGKFPAGISRLSENLIRQFLIGLWACDGWCYTKRGGNCVVSGLSFYEDDYLLHGLGLLHAMLGISMATETNKLGRSRLVATGYTDYHAIMTMIGSFKSKNLTHQPVPKKINPPTAHVAFSRLGWYEAKVRRWLRLPDGPAYTLDPTCLPKNTPKQRHTASKTP